MQIAKSSGWHIVGTHVCCPPWHSRPCTHLSDLSCPMHPTPSLSLRLGLWPRELLTIAQHVPAFPPLHLDDSDSPSHPAGEAFLPCWVPPYLAHFASLWDPQHLEGRDGAFSRALDSSHHIREGGERAVSSPLYCGLYCRNWGHSGDCPMCPCKSEMS